MAVSATIIRYQAIARKNYVQSTLNRENCVCCLEIAFLIFSLKHIRLKQGIGADEFLTRQKIKHLIK